MKDTVSQEEEDSHHLMKMVFTIFIVWFQFKQQILTYVCKDEQGSLCTGRLMYAYSCP